MMMNPTREEWDMVIELAAPLTADEVAPEHRKRYFAMLRKLLRKYPDNVNILASIADLYTYDRPAIRLLERAYLLAARNRDVRNLTWIADSLATRYAALPGFDREKVRFWIEELADNLKNYEDPDAAENLHDCRELLRSGAAVPA